MKPCSGVRIMNVALAAYAAVVAATIVPAPAQAGTFNVTTAAELEYALGAAATNGEDDLIRVAASGSPYVGNFVYAPIATENFDLRIIGGWDDAFFDRDYNPDVTVLDGNAAGRTLSLKSPFATTGSLYVEGLRLTNGKTSGDIPADGWGGGLWANTKAPGSIQIVGNFIDENAVETRGGGIAVHNAGGEVRIEGNAIMRNTSGPDSGRDNLPFAGGLFLYCDGTCTVANNLIAENVSTDSNDAGVMAGGGKGGGMMILGIAGDIRVVNNTIVGNTGDYYGGGAYFALQGPTAAVHFHVYNNIIRDNSLVHQIFSDDRDVLVDVTGALGHTVHLDHNDYRYLYSNGTVVPTYSGNNGYDPGFAPGGNFQLSSTSPLVDAGNSAAPGLPSWDCWGDPRVFAYKDRNAKIVDIGWDEYYDGSLGITTPSEHVDWIIGKTYPIGLSCANVGTNAKILLAKGSRAEGVPVLTIADPVPCAGGGVSWKVPKIADGDDYAVVAEASDYPAVQAGQGISISRIKLTAPNGGQVFKQGSQIGIRWYNGVLPSKYVKIELLSGGAPVRTIASRTPNDGAHSWKVPYTLDAGGKYGVRVTLLGTLVSTDDSDDYFTVLPAVTLVAPNGGESWTAGTRQRIAWKYANSPGATVRIELHRNSAYERTLAAKAPIGANGKGGWAWKIPSDLPAGAYRIRVQAGASAKCFDLSDGEFTVNAAP